MYHTTASKILEAKRYFDINPDGIISTGMWTHPTWRKEEFWSWFRRCLHLKTGGRELDEKDRSLIYDYRIVKAYKEQRIVRHGRNILSHKIFKRVYPEIDNPELQQY